MPTEKSKSSPSGTIKVQTAWNSDKQKGGNDTVSLNDASKMLENLVNENALARTKDRTYVVCLCRPNVLVRTTDRTVTFAASSRRGAKANIAQLREAATDLVAEFDGKYYLINKCVTLKDILGRGAKPKNRL